MRSHGYYMYEFLAVTDANIDVSEVKDEDDDGFEKYESCCTDDKPCKQVLAFEIIKGLQTPEGEEHVVGT